MEYVNDGPLVSFYYNGVKIGRYLRGEYLAIGGELRICSYSKGLYYNNTSHLTAVADSDEYAWFVELHKSFTAGNRVIEGELLTKCLDLYYLLEYRWEKTHTNVYNSDIVKSGNTSQVIELDLLENNEIMIYGRKYYVSDNFMAAAILSDKLDIYRTILEEQSDIWRSAFPPKTKSARNHNDEH
jgi:hypothetical protein